MQQKSFNPLKQCFSFTGLSFVFAITCLTAQLGQGEGSDESGVEVAVAVPLAESDDEPATGRDAEAAQTAADKRNYQVWPLPTGFFLKPHDNAIWSNAVLGEADLHLTLPASACHIGGTKCVIVGTIFSF